MSKKSDEISAKRKMRYIINKQQLRNYPTINMLLQVIGATYMDIANDFDAVFFFSLSSYFFTWSA
jgi:hypothetical protein